MTFDDARFGDEEQCITVGRLNELLCDIPNGWLIRSVEKNSLSIFNQEREQTFMIDFHGKGEIKHAWKR